MNGDRGHSKAGKVRRVQLVRHGAKCSLLGVEQMFVSFTVWVDHSIIHAAPFFFSSLMTEDKKW